MSSKEGIFHYSWLVFSDTHIEIHFIYQKLSAIRHDLKGTQKLDEVVRQPNTYFLIMNIIDCIHSNDMIIYCYHQKREFLNIVKGEKK